MKEAVPSVSCSCLPVFEAAALRDVSALASAICQNPQRWAGMEGLKAFRFTSALPPRSCCSR